ncbi:hypothetical protein K470DRAFT_292727 [Piedraia hortae CBS 480.64]|uniref:Uncharacterized protein n=1 Tax=Piedraia hortae CBS 480.64 TaxID=1314780 RepID=A0A6A7C8R1_9PEZI|nr:hypothetical protein K470DRAFT_292727 [Piedraia hortae CBS 480.64]
MLSQSGPTFGCATPKRSKTPVRPAQHSRHNFAKSMQNFIQTPHFLAEQSLQQLSKTPQGSVLPDSQAKQRKPSCEKLVSRLSQREPATAQPGKKRPLKTCEGPKELERRVRSCMKESADQNVQAKVPAQGLNERYRCEMPATPQHNGLCPFHMAHLAYYLEKLMAQVATSPAQQQKGICPSQQHPKATARVVSSTKAEQQIGMCQFQPACIFQRKPPLKRQLPMTTSAQQREETRTTKYKPPQNPCNELLGRVISLTQIPAGCHYVATSQQTPHLHQYGGLLTQVAHMKPGSQTHT